MTGMPLHVFTQADEKDKAYFQDIIDQEGIADTFEKQVDTWDVFTSGKFEDNLYAVPHDALCIVGAYGHGVIKDILFGSMVERIQATLPNPLMMVGPNYAASVGG